MALIALDARKYNDYGIGTYIRNLVEQLHTLNSAHKFILFVAKGDEGSELFPGTMQISPVRYGKYSLSELFLFASKARVKGVSVFHSPHYTLPFGLKCQSVVTIHDLIHLRFPIYYPLLRRAYSYGMIWHSIHDSRFVITDSEFTKLDILRSFRVREEKIVTIPLGVSEQFHQNVDPSLVEDFKLKFKLKCPYILFVGNTMHHKGVDVLLRAFKEVIISFPEIELVFAGGVPEADKSIRELMNNLGISKRIKSLGRISNEELILAYKGAEMFVLSSLYEGFGLPALEAMACGIPVIVSDAGSLPEVVGNAAFVCKSGNHGMFAEAMITVLRDPMLKNEMIERGRARSARFSWRTTAQKTLEVYEKTM
jgi:glycosyltransferase involved in cell wall biosynthesis